MKLVRVISALIFFAALPFMGYSFPATDLTPTPLPYMVMAGALAAFAYTEAFGGYAPAGDRLRRMSFRVLFFACLLVCAIGIIQLVAPELFN